jgi:putative redox protein
MSDAAPKRFSEPTVAAGTVVVAETGEGQFTQCLLDGRHRLLADEPSTVGGDDKGPGPYELLLMALGACTSMTLRLYANRVHWPLDRVIVRLRHSRIYAEDCAGCENKQSLLDHIEREIELLGALSPEQRTRLMAIADKCPVHKTLTSKVSIASRLVPLAA